jgi:hypothetical protein
MMVVIVNFTLPIFHVPSCKSHVQIIYMTGFMPMEDIFFLLARIEPFDFSLSYRLVVVHLEDIFSNLRVI